MSLPTEIYASSDGYWRVYRYYNGGAYLITLSVPGGKACSAYLQGDDALQFEEEFCDEDGYPREALVCGMSVARIVLQEYIEAAAAFLGVEGRVI
jgi:hypothetical protein